MPKNLRSFTQRGAVSVQSALLVGALSVGSVVGGIAYSGIQNTSTTSSASTVVEDSGICVTASYVSDLKIKKSKGDCPVDEVTPVPTQSPTSSPTPTTTPTAAPTPTPTSSPIVTPTPTPTVAPPSIGGNAGVSSVTNTSTTVGFPTRIASSSDGSKIVAIQSKKIFSSKDYGQTWKLLVDISTSIAGNSIFFSSVTTSKDGTSFYVSPGAERSASSIWFYKIDTIKETATATFLNSGDIASFTSIDASDNNGKFIAARSDGSMYRASGVGSWIKTSYTGTTQVAASSDGTKAVTVGVNGFVYKSTDSGQTWTKLTQPTVQKWVSIDSDDAGSKWFATTQSGQIFYSVDMGATWTAYDILGSGTWSNISTSSNGQVIAVGKAGTTGQVYFSKDGGSTWSISDTLSGGYWSLVRVSPDGKRFYAQNNKGLKAGVID